MRDCRRPELASSMLRGSMQKLMPWPLDSSMTWNC